MKWNRAFRPSWRFAEGQAGRPELWLAAVVVVGMLLLQVWQNSRMTELCLALEQNHSSLAQVEAKWNFVRADLERKTTRAELVPLALGLGLRPADDAQVVNLPTEYLAVAESTPRDGTVPVLAWAEGVSRAFVPEAGARIRTNR